MRSDLFWESVFTPYRRRILYPIAAVGAVVFLPLALHDFASGHGFLGAILVCIVAMLATDAIALSLERRPPIPFAFLMLPAFAGVGASLVSQGVTGLFWSYPVVFLAFFVLPARSANAIGIALAATATFLTALTQEPAFTLRYALSMALCLVVINILLNVLMALHARLVEQSITDALTGAFNRRHMEAALDEAIERQRRSGASATAVLIDIDHFKRINDRCGHDAGDHALKGLVNMIQARRRKLDLLFRQGGEEFLLLLPDTRAAEAMVVAENLRQAVAQSHLLPGMPVTVSIGVGELRADDTAAAWMKRVDDALYRAKGAGRNRVLGAEPHVIPAQAVPALRRAS